MKKQSKIAIITKTVAVLVLALLVIRCAEADAETMYVHVAEGSHLNARERPKTGSIQAKLERGWDVEVVEYRDGWAAIEGWGECGLCWVDAKYLSPDPAALPEECEPVEMHTNAEKVRLRSYPAGQVVARLPKGTVVTVTAWAEESGEKWARTEKGWIMAKFLE